MNNLTDEQVSNLRSAAREHRRVMDSIESALEMHALDAGDAIGDLMDACSFVDTMAAILLDES